MGKLWQYKTTSANDWSDPVEPDGEGWELVAATTHPMSIGYRHNWFWRRSAECAAADNAAELERLTADGAEGNARYVLEKYKCVAEWRDYPTKRMFDLFVREYGFSDNDMAIRALNAYWAAHKLIVRIDTLRANGPESAR